MLASERENSIKDQRAHGVGELKVYTTWFEVNILKTGKGTADTTKELRSSSRVYRNGANERENSAVGSALARKLGEISNEEETGIPKSQ